MYWYTRNAAKKINSGALMADAWHHRSDALSSVGSFVGIFGARMGFPMLDPLASVVICLFVVKAAVDIFRDAISKMTNTMSILRSVQTATRSCGKHMPLPRTFIRPSSISSHWSNIAWFMLTRHKTFIIRIKSTNFNIENNIEKFNSVRSITIKKRISKGLIQKQVSAARAACVE